ncbi:zinc-binding dehydrogenase [Xenorhabdus bovienii]|uniref:zinc-binding dehydrogenase n=1 Tax=Xenorhabdus bovienii TaxID=40576 RepID=UPI0023B26C6D|nr:zinc-binding dehydrogenase [Xenorhabdus bovienii]MDE9482410.1 zinc-binding dehydrogenase [Xenorhabdus bovienii]MDE9556286.1 zinc-binding dehydrogenase [Xenorhabdus bovienii]
MRNQDMKVLQLTENQHVEQREVAIAARPAAGMVRLKMSYITLNHLDLFSYRGMAFARRQLPIVVGAEGAGEVVAVADEQDAHWLGKYAVVYPSYFCGQCKNCLARQENLCLGGGGILGFHRDGLAREYADIPSAMLIAVPDDVSLTDAACAPVTCATVHHMLVNNAELQRGESVLIHSGGSGIGSVAIRLALHLGAAVYTTVGSEEKAALARELGAEIAINYRQKRFSQVIHTLTYKRGVNVVFEHVGKNTWEQSITSLALGGRLVTCGSTSGMEGNTPLYTLFNRQLRIIGSFGSPKASVQASLTLMAKRQVLPVIDSIYPIEEYVQAIEKLRQRSVFGKLVLKMWG